MTEPEIANFLGSSMTAVLTTLSSKGWPHSVGMWFVPKEDEVLMWSYAKSQKSVNAMRDPRCAFMVESGVHYFELKGVLVQSRVRVVKEFEAIAAIGKALHERYVSSVTGEPPDEASLAEINRQAGKRVGLALPLEKVASWDHSKLGNA
jgi:hypothetical protein